MSDRKRARYDESDNKDRSQRDFSYDDPPFSRLFVIGSRGTTESVYRQAFEQYGELKDIWMLKDRRTGEESGLCYVKFSKASEAALAMQSLHQKAVGNHPKPIKVVPASQRNEGSSREANEDAKMLRIFIKCSTDVTEDDLKEEFKEFGEIDYVSIIKDKITNKSKGLAYVKYFKPYYAAMALEQCDPAYKPLFADLRRSDMRKSEGDRGRSRRDRSRDKDKDWNSSYSRDRYGSDSRFDDQRYDQRYESDYSSQSRDYYDPYGSYYSGEAFMSTPSGSANPISSVSGYPNNGQCRLYVRLTGGCTESQLFKLFDVIPGLEYCDVNFDTINQTGHAYVKYANGHSASYAREKLHGLEYPPGCPLQITFHDRPSNDNQPPSLMSTSSLPTNAPSLKDPAFLQQALGILQAAGLNTNAISSGIVGNKGGAGMADSRCSTRLPPPQVLAPQRTDTQQRLFIVCNPRPVPPEYLEDAFCRFGDLIEVYLLPSKNYGFARYASKSSAQEAMRTLHGEELCGSRLKVLVADDEKPPRH